MLLKNKKSGNVWQIEDVKRQEWLLKSGEFEEVKLFMDPNTSRPLGDLTVAELTSCAATRGVNLVGITKKADIIAAIQAADNEDKG